MNRAYDGVEWNVLRAMLEKLGFAGECIDMLMECVYSASYSVHFNSIETDRFLPTTGHRHKDPLSPYLFLLYVEGL